MRTVTLIYHYGGGRWWATSPDPGLESFTVGGTFTPGGTPQDEVRRKAHEAVVSYLGEEVELRQRADGPVHGDKPCRCWDPSVGTLVGEIRYALRARRLRRAARL
jgi:hypothetical protein